jgi:superfamily II DNA or RNA helicase
MSLTALVQREFTTAIRERGDRYAREQRVVLRDLSPDRARAVVRGSKGSPYRVEIWVERAGRRVEIDFDCSCPHASEGANCKHIWATLRALDARGWEPGSLAGAKPITASRGGDDESDAFDADDSFFDEDDDPFDELDPELEFPFDRNLVAHRALRGWAPSGDPLRSIRAAALRQPGTPPNWRSRLERLRARASRENPAGVQAAFRPLLAPAPSASPLCYLLDPQEIAREQKLTLRFARRSLRRDGAPGVLQPSSIGSAEIAAAANPEEAAILAQLVALGEAQRGGPFQSYGRNLGTVVLSSVEIPPVLVPTLVPQLARTERLGLLALPPVTAVERRYAKSRVPREEPRWLHVDDGNAWQPRLALTPAGSGDVGAGGSGAAELRVYFARGDERLGFDRVDLLLSCGLLVSAEALARCEIGDAANALAELGPTPLRIPASSLDRAIAGLAALPGLPPLEFDSSFSWTERCERPLPRLRFEGLDELRRAIPARLDFCYAGHWLPAESEDAALADRRTRVWVARDRGAEADALQYLSALGFWSAREDDFRASRHKPSLTAGVKIARDRFEAVASELLAKGWQLEAEGARLRRPGSSRAVVRSGLDFFELQGAVDFEGEAVGFPALLRAAREQKLVQLGDGSRGILPKIWIERCERMLAAADEVDGEDALRFSLAQLGLVDALLASQDDAKSDARFDELRSALADFRGIEAQHEPAGFGGELRNYQREGLGWLAFLRRFGLGGCLADDMGLGKTVQVLALLAATAREAAPANASAQPRAKRAREPAAGEWKPWLVVAPKSVVHGWIAEAERFAPELRVVRYAGADRSRLRAQLQASHLVVTSYGTLLRDAEWLASQYFDCVVLDEAQAIKNANSKTARAARALRASQRLALTGTPIENHLGELASLLDFLNPGMLGRAQGLSALTSGRADAADLELLSRALRPLLLRRTKQQVLSELPARSEQILLCELEPAQRRDYDELRRHFQKSLGRRIDADGLARSKIYVLEALLRLRQAACHPALIDRERANEPSAKLGVLFEQLEELLEEGHKALIFSQFTRFLSLVRSGLEERGIAHAYLDGRTRDRAERIAQFQNDPACRVFAISLKAGGTGLNLTAADYVFLLDPWWNPAVEAQAVDRAHRIGQTRPVMAYRLVAKDTIEEKILTLQKSKRELAASVLGDERSFLGSLSHEDLELLLA